MIGNIVCEDLIPFFRVLRYVLNLIKWLIPIVLIVMVTIDLVKTITGNDKDFSEVKTKIFKRVLYAVVIFLVPAIISLIFRNIGRSVSTGDLTSPTDWISCYSQVISSSGSSDGGINPNSVICDEVNVVIKLGQTTSLKCKVTPQNANNKSLKYSVNNDNIVINGKTILAKKVGISKIIVTSSNNKKAEVNVTVVENEVLATGFYINNKNINLQVGEQKEISYSFSPNNVTNKMVTYSSFDNSIISINNNVITALKEGNTTIVANTSNGLKDTINVVVKNKNICDEDSIKPNIHVVGNYIYTKLDNNMPYANEPVEMKVEVSDNCKVKLITYCVDDINKECSNHKIINNNETIVIKGDGNKKVSIIVTDEKGNKNIGEYYIKFPEKENDNNNEDDLVEPPKEYVCYLGYSCSKGYYYASYDEYLGSCYEDTHFLFFNTGRKQVGNPYPKFYDNMNSLNNDVKTKKTGLVGGWDDAKNAYRFLYKCDSPCSSAGVSNCRSYAYYDPTTDKITEDSQVVDNWSYFDYLNEINR